MTDFLPKIPEYKDNRQPALLYLEPCEEWLSKWERMRSAAPFNFLPAPMVGLLRPHELMPESRIESKLDAVRAQLPITLTVRNVELVYSPHNDGSVLTFFFQENLDTVRNALGPFGKNNPIYNDGRFVPHMIVSRPIALSRANQAFIMYVKTYTHGTEIRFDSLDMQYGESWNPNTLYEPYVESMTEAMGRG